MLFTTSPVNGFAGGSVPERRIGGLSDVFTVVAVGVKAQEDPKMLAETGLGVVAWTVCVLYSEHKRDITGILSGH